MTPAQRTPRKAVRERMWAVTFDFDGERTFYTGTYLTVKDAREQHAGQLDRTWQSCYDRGDRVVKVEVRELPAARQRRGR